MSGEGGLFLDDCGASGPLRLEWDDGESGEAVGRDFDRPAVVVGQNPEADLSLSHPRVGRRHAYLQMIEGRLYAIDLESRDGLRWSGVPRRSGWVDRRRPVRLGPTTIRVAGGDRDGSEEPGPGPLSSRFVSRQALPGVVLELRGAGAGPRRWSMDRPLALVGRSPDCKVRLLEPGASRFACGLVRTPRGVWMVDLLSSRGVAVNGVVRRQARLEDGDVLRVGDEAIRLTYDGLEDRPRPRAAAGIAPTAPRDLPDRADPPPTEPGQETWELVPEMILRRLEGREGPASGPPAAFDPALVMLVRLLGEIHRDHLQVVREEMEQIRRLGQELAALKAQAPSPRPHPPALDPSRPAPEPPPARDRPASPGAVQALVGERLAAWEKERRSRWRKVMGLLIQP